MFIKYHCRLIALQQELPIIQKDPKLLDNGLKYKNIIHILKVYDIICICFQFICIIILIVYYSSILCITHIWLYTVLLAIILISRGYNYIYLKSIMITSILNRGLLNHFRTKSQSVLYVDDIDLNSNYMKNKISEDKKYIKLIANNNKYNIGTVILKRSLKEKDALKLLSKFCKNQRFVPAYYDESNKLKYICNSYTIHAYSIYLTTKISLLCESQTLSILFAILFSIIPIIIFSIVLIYCRNRLENNIYIKQFIEFSDNLDKKDRSFNKILEMFTLGYMKFGVMCYVLLVLQFIYYLWNKLLTYILQRPYPKNDVLNYYIAVIDGKPKFLHNYDKYKYVVRVVNKKNKKNIEILDNMNNIYIES